MDIESTDVNLLIDDFEDSTPMIVISAVMQRNEAGKAESVLTMRMNNISNVGVMVHLLLAIEALGEELTEDEHKELLAVLEEMDEEDDD